MSELAQEISTALNRHSAENGSDTPDFILAGLLTDVLVAWDKAVVARERWYGREAGNGAAILSGGEPADPGAVHPAELEAQFMPDGVFDQFKDWLRTLGYEPDVVRDVTVTPRGAELTVYELDERGSKFVDHTGRSAATRVVNLRRREWRGSEVDEVVGA